MLIPDFWQPLLLLYVSFTVQAIALPTKIRCFLNPQILSTTDLNPNTLFVSYFFVFI